MMLSQDGKPHRVFLCLPLGVRLEDMGSSEDAAKRFLQTIAPPESNRTATLISASQFR